MESLALWLCGAGLLLILVSVAAVASANIVAWRDDKLLAMTKLFKQIFSESRPKDGDKK